MEPIKGELYYDSEGDWWKWLEDEGSWAYHDGIEWVAREFCYEDTGVVSYGKDSGWLELS